MVPDVPSAPHPESQNLLTWLEQQRQADHERLIELNRIVEQLCDEARSQRTLLAHLGELEHSADDSRATTAEAIAQLKEHIGLVQRALAEHVEAVSRAEQVEGAQRERMLRQTAELAQQVLSLGRAADATNGRLAALIEEVRRLRDDRPALLQAVDELQRGQAALQSRVAVAEEIIRRQGAFQAVAEQSDERRRADLTRLDNQQKLLEVRLAREVGELRRSTDELVTRTDDRLKPITELARQVVGLVEGRAVVEQRLAGIAREIEQIRSEIERLEALGRTDRATTKRLSEQFEGYDRKHDEVTALLWQLGERVNTVLDRVSDLGDHLAALVTRVEATERQIALLDDERQRLDANLSRVEAALHAEQRGRGDQTDSLLAHVDAEVSSLRSQIEEIRRQAIQHVRRSVEVLQQQLSELDTDQR